MSGGSASPASPDRSAAARRLWLRLPLLAGGALALILGVASGLQRLGWDSFDGVANLAELHGPLMVCGFLGTVIALERAVAYRRLWAYLGPAAAAVGTMATFAPVGVIFAQAGWLVAGVVLAAVSSITAARYRAPFTLVLAIGAVAWPIGTLKWSAGVPVEVAVLWWLSFLVLTIAAERLELNRVLRPTVLSQDLFWAPVALLLFAAILVSLDGSAGWRIAGAALLGLAAWLARHDVARRTIRLPGLPRFAASCLLSGYAWLAVAGVTMLGLSPNEDRLAYDAALHAVFLGFAFAMVFGHAPIILPAITGVQVSFSAWLYMPLAILNLSVVARVGGDLLGGFEIRRWSGLLSAAAIALFIAMMAGLVRRGPGRPSARRICGGTKTKSAGGAKFAP